MCCITSEISEELTEGLSTPSAPAAGSELSGKWTKWINSVNPYEEGQRGDFEIRKDMDHVSSNQSCYGSSQNIEIILQLFKLFG